MYDSINISLKLYFNKKVKGDFNISSKSSTDCINSQVPNGNNTTQTEGGLPVVED